MADEKVITLTVHRVPSIVNTALEVRTAERFIPPHRWGQYLVRRASLGFPEPGVTQEEVVRAPR